MFSSFYASWTIGALEVELYPTSTRGNFSSDSGIYSPDFIKNNYSLTKDQPDFTLKQDFTLQSAAIYRGSCILTDYAVEKTRKTLSDYLANEPDTGSLAYKSLKGIQDYLDKTPLVALSQSLGGFNQALLMRKQTLQLAINDPLAFPDYGEFTTDIKARLSPF